MIFARVGGGTLKDDASQRLDGPRRGRARKARVCMQVAISRCGWYHRLFRKPGQPAGVDRALKPKIVVTFRISPGERLHARAVPRAVRGGRRRWPQSRACAASGSMVSLIAGTTGVATSRRGLRRGPNAGRDTHARYTESAGFLRQDGNPASVGRDLLSATTWAVQSGVGKRAVRAPLLGNTNPLGRRFRPGWGKATPISIRGGGQERELCRREAGDPGVDYTPWRQDKEPDSLSLLRTALDPVQGDPQCGECVLHDADLPLKSLAPRRAGAQQRAERPAGAHCRRIASWPRHGKRAVWGYGLQRHRATPRSAYGGTGRAAGGIRGWCSGTVVSLGAGC